MDDTGRTERFQQPEFLQKPLDRWTSSPVLRNNLCRFPCCFFYVFFFHPLQELFYFLLLPPIIFEAGYTLRKKDFFHNILSIVMFAVLGTLVSTFIIGYLTYLAGKLVSSVSTAVIAPGHCCRCGFSTAATFVVAAFYLLLLFVQHEHVSELTPLS